MLTQYRDVLSTILGKSTQTVEKVELGSWQTDRSGVLRVCARHGQRGDGCAPPRPCDLFSEAAMLTDQNDSRGSMQKIEVLGAQVPGVEHEQPSSFLRSAQYGLLSILHHGLKQVLEILGIGAPFFVQKHDIHREAFASPVLLTSQQLAHDLAIIGVVDPQQQNRMISRNAVPPQLPGAAGAAANRVLRGTQRGVEIKQRTGDVLKQIGLVRADAKMVALHLSVRPREHRYPSEHRGIVILVRQAHDLFARPSYHRAERQMDRCTRCHPHPCAQTEYRIEHGSRRI